MNHTNIDQLPLDRFPHAEYVRARDSIKPVLELSLLKEVVDAHRFHYGIVSNAEGISWDACFSLLLRDPDMRDALLKGWQRGIFDDLRGTASFQSLLKKKQTVGKALAHMNLQQAVTHGGVFTNIGGDQNVFNYGDNHRTKITEWISKLDFLPIHRDILNKRTKGTGLWFFESDAFMEWYNAATSAILWCPGKPGAGKTVLTSIVIDHFQKQANAMVCFVYFNYKSQADVKYDDIIYSLLRQFYQLQPNLFSSVEDIYQANDDACRLPLSLEVATNALRTAVSQCNQFYVALDALDEFQGRFDETEIGNLVDFILSLGSKIKLMVTSRVIDGINKKLKSYKPYQVEISTRELDVKQYIKERLKHDAIAFRHKPNEQLARKVIQKVLSVAGAHFLLAKLHLDTLCQLPLLRDIDIALQRLSDHIDFAYDQILERIKEQGSWCWELAVKIFSWITCSQRYLSLQELQHALAVWPGMKTLDNDYDTHEESTLLSVCAGLVIVEPHSETVRFIHYTTQEFFSKKWDALFPTAQLDIAQTCVTYLSLDVLDFQVKADEAITTVKASHEAYLLDYAADFWPFHLQQQEDETCDRILLDVNNRRKIGTKAFFMGECSYGDITHVLARKGLHRALSGIIKLSGNSLAVDMGDTVGRTPLSYAAESGSEAVIRVLLEYGNIAVGLKDSIGHTPLFYAVQNGHGSIVKLLLECQDLQAMKNDCFWTLLYCAVEKEHKSIVMHLLECRNIDSRDDHGCTLLSHAAEKGHKAIVILFLEHGDTNADLTDNKGRTPLSYAAEKGHEAIVMLLLKHKDIKANLKDDEHHTPLFYAVQNGHESVVKLFLECRNVSADATDHLNRTPLSFPTENGYKSIVELLLGCTDVNVNSQTRDQISQFAHGRTPLSYAAEKGHEAIVMMLLKHGDIKVNLDNDKCRVPLSYAAEKGHEAIVMLLLKHKDIKADLKDDEHCTPLSYAAEKGHESVVALLLKSGYVNADSSDHFNRTPLSYASENEHESVVEFLLEYTLYINVNSQTSAQISHSCNFAHGRTPLSYAAEKGHEAIVMMLLKHRDIKANLQDNKRRTPLFYAAENGHESVVQLLLVCRNISATSQDHLHRTPLFYAVAKGHQSVINLLLSCKGVKPDLKDIDGRTPLSLAAEKGQDAVVKSLLERWDIVADSKDVSGRTPLSFAAEKGQDAVVKSLLDSRRVVLADSKDESGRTPLSYAAQHGQVSIIKMLLDRRNVDVASKDSEGYTPLHYAEKGWDGQIEAAAVKLLQPNKIPNLQGHPVNPELSQRRNRRT